MSEERDVCVNTESGSPEAENMPVTDISMAGMEELQVVYVVRHCKAEGQEAAARLTPEGWRQAERLASLLAPFSIERVVASPFARAVKTIEPFCRRMNLELTTDARLAERRLSGAQLPDWMRCLEQTFEDADLRYPGGETGREAASRAVSAIDDLLGLKIRGAVVVTHGNLLALLLGHYDNRIGFEQWKRLTNPDVYRLTFHSGRFQSMERIEGVCRAVKTDH
ncbi:histidine phosphatase family protein [Paenibacillus doosanensis]|uniref:histidine phosphatase family protein n=1 Tax=Paenibacillus doosanensis TaxID=1229154 RepID=UPI00217F887D|nr:histidine phosphatase family protein [Paenibacillus doosanensis]